MEKIIESLENIEHIDGHTHAFYNYPARFHPAFARSTIEYFTEKGDCVIDPFMGSGTAGVEALACGRRFLGIDINPIASFLAKVKMTPLSSKDIILLNSWHKTIPYRINLHDSIEIEKTWQGYSKHLPWWLRKTISFILHFIEKDLESERCIDFSRAVLLSTGQWSLDCKKTVPTTKQFIAKFLERYQLMLSDIVYYQAQLKQSIDVPLTQIDRRRKVINRSIIDICDDKRLTMNWVPAKLILTSPPYPGVHVVYNRWQIMGRKETPAPFWVIQSKDGNGLSYYTLGDRKQLNLNNYFNNLKASFESIKSLINHDSIIIQLVGFSDPSWQLDKYLNVMNEIGYEEIEVISNSKTRYWRKVPNRKWYTQYSETKSSSDREFLLLHKLL